MSDLKDFRERHEFTQADLAELWDVTPVMISKFENSDGLPAIARYAMRATEAELTGIEGEREGNRQRENKPRRLGRHPDALVQGMKPAKA